MDAYSLQGDSIESNLIPTGLPDASSSSIILSAAINVGDVIPIEKTAKSATDAKRISTISEMMMTENGEWYFILYCFEFILLCTA